MKTAEKTVSIDERLKSREFRDALREHPIIKAKVQRAKQALGIDDNGHEPQHPQKSVQQDRFTTF